MCDLMFDNEYCFLCVCVLYPSNLRYLCPVKQSTSTCSLYDLSCTFPNHKKIKLQNYNNRSTPIYKFVTKMFKRQRHQIINNIHENI